MKREELTQAFLSKHPDIAARVLEGQAADEVAVLFSELPVRLILPVVRRINPAMAARVLLSMDFDDQVAIFSQLGPRNSANVLRNWPAEKRTQVFKSLPTLLSGRIRVLLDYAPDVVGSIMNTEFITANVHHPVGDIEAVIRKLKIDHQYDVYVVDDELCLRGAVSVLKLLREDSKKPVHQIMDRNIASITATTNITSAINHIGWESRTALPVVDRDQHVVGILHQAMCLARPEIRDSLDTGLGYLAADVLDLYWMGWKSIFGALLAKS